MKKLCFKGLALFALIIVLAACSNPADTPTPAPYTPLSISGRFTTDEGTAYFKAQEGSGTAASIQRAVARAVSATEVAISGDLDDGEITFHLKGFYDKESGAYTLQAASSRIKYSITGTAGGGASASVATRSGADQPFIPLPTVQVETEISGDVLADGMTSTEENTDIAEGLTRDDVYGVWYDEETNGLYKAVVNEWGISTMVKKDGEWVEEQVLGFSKIIKNADDSIDVIGDATMASYTVDGPSYDHEEFLAYVENKGYQIFDRQTPLPGPGLSDVFPYLFFHHNFDGFDQSGALVKGNNNYLVEIYYDPAGQYTGTEEEPFVVVGIKQEGEEYPFYGSSSLICAATLEGAIAEALAAIRATGDSAAVYDPPIPWTFTTGGRKASAVIQAWEEANPRPGTGDTDALTDYVLRRSAVVKEQFLENFPSLDPDTFIIEGSEEYTELQSQYTAELEAAAEETVTYETAYYKWNIAEENGRLIITAYSSDGTEETMFAENYAGAEALNTLMGEPFVTLSR